MMTLLVFAIVGAFACGFVLGGMLAVGAALQIIDHRRWNPIVKPVATKYLQTLVVGAVIGSSGAGRNGIERVADDIRKDQRDQTRGRAALRSVVTRNSCGFGAGAPHDRAH